MTTVEINQPHYWWGDCASCEAITVIGSNEPIGTTHGYATPVCFSCGGSLAWNEGR